MKIRGFEGWLVRARFCAKGEARAAEIEEKSVFDFCRGQIVDELSAMLVGYSRSYFQFDYQFVRDNEIGLEDTDFYSFIDYGNSGMNFIRDIGFTQFMSQSISINSLGKSTT